MQKEKISEYIQTMYAASNFYGAIEFGEFTRTYFDMLEYDDVYRIFELARKSRRIKAHKIDGLYYLSCYGKKECKECIERQEGTKLKVVSKAELLKWFDHEYYPDNKLARYLREHGMSEKDIVGVMNTMMLINHDPLKILSFITSKLGVPEKEAWDVLYETGKNIPMHIFRGFTAEEYTEAGNIKEENTSEMVM